MSSTALYAHLLGPDWERLPERVRRLHTEGLARGHFTLRRGPGPLAALVSWLLRLPPAGEDVPTRLAIRPHGEGLCWERAFGPHALVTHQHGAAGPRLVEWHGPIACVFRLSAEAAGLRYEQVEAWVRLGPWTWRVPRPLAPRVEARVTDSPEGMHVHVRLGAALVGTLLSYEGRVLPEETPP